MGGGAQEGSLQHGQHGPGTQGGGADTDDGDTVLHCDVRMMILSSTARENVINNVLK